MRNKRNRYARGFSIFIPYIWPAKERKLHLHMFLVALCLAVKRVLVVLEPRQMGIVLDLLAQGEVPVLQAALFVFYRWTALSGLGPLRRALWLPVEQYCPPRELVVLETWLLEANRQLGTLTDRSQRQRSITSWVYHAISMRTRSLELSTSRSTKAPLSTNFSRAYCSQSYRWESI